MTKNEDVNNATLLFRDLWDHTMFECLSASIKPIDDNVRVPMLMLYVKEMHATTVAMKMSILDELYEKEGL